MVRRILPVLLALAGLVLAGCGDYGTVEQGRTVAFDKAKGVISIIKDTGIVDRNPQYTVLPAHDFILPTDPAERGADPSVGLRMRIDVEKKTITMYNPGKKEFDVIAVEVVANHQNVDLRRRHPLVWDAATNKAIKFPKVNATDRTVEIYSRRQRMVTTIKLADADFNRYKEQDWDAGDEVRLYYKKDGVALRFMNVTKTDVTRRR